MATGKPYPDALRRRAVALYDILRPDHGSARSAYEEVARLLGIGSPDTVRRWVRDRPKDEESVNHVPCRDHRPRSASALLRATRTRRSRLPEESSWLPDLARVLLSLLPVLLALINMA